MIFDLITFLFKRFRIDFHTWKNIDAMKPRLRHQRTVTQDLYTSILVVRGRNTVNSLYS
jgi:hypothetical protein